MKRTLIPIALLVLGLSVLAGCASQTPKGRANAVAAPQAPASKPADVDIARLPQVGDYRAAAVSGDYAGYAALDRFIDRMVSQYGYTREYLNGVFSQARRKQWTIEYMNRQAPSGPSTPGVVSKPSPGGWSRYRAKFLDEQHIGKGAAFWAQHADALQRASERYGVPPEYIMGIMGVETIFGANVGKDRVLDALTTLAFDYPRRAEYFTEELANFLVMTRKEGLDPAQPQALSPAPWGWVSSCRAASCASRWISTATAAVICGARRTPSAASPTTSPPTAGGRRSRW